MDMLSLSTFFLVGLFSIGMVVSPGPGPTTPAKSVYDFTMKTIDGQDRSLSAYQGKVLMIVNVASKCGYTPQYEGLEKLYETYKDRGFMILGFPANNFMGQEPGSDEEIKQFCTLEYGVTFDMFSKISVKGKDQDPLYAFITSDPAVEGPVKWNFQKYLVNREGKLVSKFLSGTKPMDKQVISVIEELLGPSK